jgi:hypothetical protein
MKRGIIDINSYMKLKAVWKLFLVAVVFFSESLHASSICNVVYGGNPYRNAQILPDLFSKINKSAPKTQELYEKMVQDRFHNDNPFNELPTLEPVGWVLEKGVQSFTQRKYRTNVNTITWANGSEGFVISQLKRASKTRQTRDLIYIIIMI